MSASDLEMKLQRVIAQGIDEFPRASPVDLVRWTRENHGPLVERAERKWTDDKLVSLYLTEMRRRNAAEQRHQDAASETDTLFQEQTETAPPQSNVAPDKLKSPDRAGRSPLDKKGRPRFGHPNQSRLPFSEKFEQIPYYLMLSPRTRTSRGIQVRLPDATLADLKKRRAFIRGEQSIELPQLNRLIQIMEPYNRMTPGITVKKALELRSTAKREERA